MQFLASSSGACFQLQMLRAQFCVTARLEESEICARSMEMRFSWQGIIFHHVMECYTWIHHLCFQRTQFIVHGNGYW